MNFAAKLMFFVVMTVAAAMIGLWPEMAMLGLWKVAAPETEVARIVLILAFLTFGTGLSVMFGTIGFMAWVTGCASLLDS